MMNQCQFCLRSTYHENTCDECREVFEDKIDTNVVSDKLRLLADWLDKKYPNDSNPEVQNDLRTMANDYSLLCAERDSLAEENEKLKNKLDEINKNWNLELIATVNPKHCQQTFEIRDYETHQDCGFQYRAYGVNEDDDTYRICFPNHKGSPEIELVAQDAYDLGMHALSYAARDGVKIKLPVMPSMIYTVYVDGEYVTISQLQTRALQTSEYKSIIDQLLKALPKDTFTSHAYEQSDFMSFLLAVYKILYEPSERQKFLNSL